MSQNSLVLPTTGTVSGLTMTQDTNSALDTLNTLASGPSAPSSPEAGQLWHDTANNIIKLRSLDGTTWIPLLNLNESAYTSNPAVATPAFGVSSSVTPNMAGVMGSMGGGFLNKIRNGACMVAQRGAGGTIVAGTPAYTLDGHVVGCTGANVTWGQGGPMTVGNNTYANSLVIAGATGATDVFIRHRVESYDAASLSGLPNTFQLAIGNATGASLTPTITVKYPNAQDVFTSQTTVLSATNMTAVANGAAQVETYTYSMPTQQNGAEITIDFGAALNSAAKSVTVSGFDLRAAPGAATGINSPPTPEVKGIAFEEMWCERFARVINYTPLAVVGWGWVNASNSAEIFIPLNTKMRAVPSLSLPAASNFNVNFIVPSAVSGSNADDTSPYVLSMFATVSSGLTASNAAALRWVGSGGSGAIVISAEL